MAKKKVVEEEEYLGEEEYDDEPEAEPEELEFPEEERFPIAAVPTKVIGSTKKDPTRLTSSTPESQKTGVVVERRAKFAEGVVVRDRKES